MINPVACPGICKGGGAKSESFFLAFQFFRGERPAQKISENIILPT